MCPKITLFVALLIAAAVSAARIDPASRQLSDRLRAARRQCKKQKALICILSPVSGSSISGKVLFIPAFRVVKGEPQCDVRVRAKIKGLSARRHGFHIHTYGDISADDGTSTGGHFTNPDDTPVDHGLPNDAIRHWGDMGNLRNNNGMSTYNRIDTVISLAGIAGRGITVHEGRDMGAAEQPTGASGGRVAVCVIGYANPANLNL